MLAAARQAEFEKWKGHLLGLEAALQAAQSEATNYRYGCRDVGQVWLTAVFGGSLRGCKLALWTTGY